MPSGDHTSLHTQSQTQTQTQEREQAQELNQCLTTSTGARAGSTRRAANNTHTPDYERRTTNNGIQAAHTDAWRAGMAVLWRGERSERASERCARALACIGVTVRGVVRDAGRVWRLVASGGVRWRPEGRYRCALCVVCCAFVRLCVCVLCVRLCVCGGVCSLLWGCSSNGRALA